MIDIPIDLLQPKSHFESVIPADYAARVKQHAYRMMNELGGWCSFAKASILIDVILRHKPKVLLEIGVWGGKSLVPMAYALKMNGIGVIYGIDPWEPEESVKYAKHEDNIKHWLLADHEAVMRMLISKIENFDLVSQVKLVRSTSENAEPIFEIDLLHIDGNHSETTSYFDVAKWVPLVRSGGWIIMDDLTWFEGDIYTTARAVHWLDEHCIKIAEFSDNCVWGIWVKP